MAKSQKIIDAFADSIWKEKPILLADGRIHVKVGNIPRSLAQGENYSVKEDKKNKNVKRLYYNDEGTSKLVLPTGEVAHYEKKVIVDLAVQSLKKQLLDGRKQMSIAVVVADLLKVYKISGNSLKNLYLGGGSDSDDFRRLKRQAQELATLEAVKKDTTETTKKVAAVEKNVAKLQGDIHDHGDALKKHEASLKAVKKDTTETKKKVAGLETDVAELVEEFHDMPASLQEAHDVLNDHADDIDKNSNNIVKLTKKFAEFEEFMNDRNN